MDGFVEVGHNLHRGLVADRPKGYEQILRSGFNETTPQPHHALASSGFAGTSVTGR